MPRKQSAPRKSELTRRRILTEAAAAYREHGVDGVGVREIMQRAGLTQGGFYAHFSDKDALFREASALEFEATSTRFVDPAVDPSLQPQAFIDSYLSVWHRDHPQEGCFMATLGSEMARASFEQRYAFAQGPAMSVKLIAPHMPGKDISERVNNAMVLVTSMTGVLIVARVIAGTPMSDALLANARRFFSESFARRC